MGKGTPDSSGLKLFKEFAADRLRLLYGAFKIWRLGSTPLPNKTYAKAIAEAID